MSVAGAAMQWLQSRSPEPPAALLGRMAEAVRAVAELDERSEAPDGCAAGAAASTVVEGTEGVGAARGGAGAADLESVARCLAEAAVDRLRVVLEAPGDRSAALDLLAADALLTYSIEAAAEAGPASLSTVARDYGPERLAELLPTVSR